MESTIGQQIREAREHLGLSQRQVIELVEATCELPADTLRLRQRTLWRWENDERSLRILNGGGPSLGAAAMLAFLNQMDLQR